MKTRILIIFTTISFLVTACGRKTDRQSDDNSLSREVPVIVQTTAPRDLNEFIQLTGKLEGCTDIVMTSETNGKILQLHKNLGDWVERGEEIGRVDNLDYEIRLQQAQASVLAAEATLETARMQMESSEKLFQEDRISRVEYSQAKSNLKNAQAGLNGAQANLEQAQKAYDNSRFLAPVSGYIADLPIKVGEMLTAGMPICSIVDSKKLVIRTGVSETSVQKLSKGQRVFIRYDALDEDFIGHISGIGIRPLRNSAMYPVEIELDNPGNRLLPGMAVEGRVLANTYRKVIYTSLNNIIREYDSNYIFTVDEEDRAVKKAVKLGIEIGENVIIAEGLEFGERLVIEGMENLENGIQVKIREPLN
ncbi:MAG: efflux RND transporter periplasmic adaptor subunit [Candidatus Cloacimonetes bacterium]|nr:efflux RND transporter periplasmic adaptor subunit [Candidatus Cloacimonadota bacterium]